MSNELFQNIIKTGISLFIKDKEKAENATPAELHQAMIEANADLKTEVINGIVNTLSEQFETAVTTQVSAFTEKIKSDSDAVIESYKAKVAELESKMTELNANDFNAKFETAKAELRTELGAEVLEIKAKAGQALPSGDNKIIETHTPEVKKTPVVKVFGA